MSVVHVIGALGWTVQGGVLLALAVSRLLAVDKVGGRVEIAGGPIR